MGSATVLPYLARADDSDLAVRPWLGKGDYWNLFSCRNCHDPDRRNLLPNWDMGLVLLESGCAPILFAYGLRPSISLAISCTTSQFPADSSTFLTLT